MADINTVIAKIQLALNEANAAAVPDVQQNSDLVDADWLQGSRGTLDVLGHFSSPAGKTLKLAATGLPLGVTVAGGSLAYDGSSVFANGVTLNLGQQIVVSAV